MTDHRWAPLGAKLALVFLLLSGCSLRPRSETIVIPDEAAEESGTGQTGQPFEMKTIYRLPAGDERGLGTLEWASADAVVGVFGELGRATVQRMTPPYEKRQLVKTLSEDTLLASLSPGGRYLATGERDGEAVRLKLLTLSDGEEREIETLNLANGTEREATLGKSAAWSDNGRFFAYTLVSSDRRVDTGFGVYDAESGTTKHYWLTDWNRQEYPLSAKPSDDGLSALIVKKSATGTRFVLGGLEAGVFETWHEQALGPEGQADWISGDQVAFVGPEGALNAFDRRNSAVSVLIPQAGEFRLSPDKKYIAYTTGKDTIYAGKLQGNNVLSDIAVYQGIVPYEMAWRRDNGALLVSGRKPYERESLAWNRESTAVPAEAVPAPAADDSLPFIIEFQ